MGLTRPTVERLRHASIVDDVVIDDTDAAGNKLSVCTLRIVDWILDRLHHRKIPAVNADQYYAGSRFYVDWYHSHPSGSCTLNPNRTIVDNGAKYFNETERQMIAKLRFEKALRALCRRHRQVLQSCLIEEESLASFGYRAYAYRDKKNASMVALNTLRDALDVLVEHYRGRRS
jgi:hypothetical protein